MDRRREKPVVNRSYKQLAVREKPYLWKSPEDDLAAAEMSVHCERAAVEAHFGGTSGACCPVIDSVN